MLSFSHCYLHLNKNVKFLRVGLQKCYLWNILHPILKIVLYPKIYPEIMVDSNIYF